LVPRSELTHGESLERMVLRTPGESSARQERHIAPPKTWAMMAEMFGLFDSAIGIGKNTKEIFGLAERGDGAFKEGPHQGETLSLPYLPDPLAAGVTFRGLPGMPKGMMATVRNGRLEFEPLRLPPAVVENIGSLLLIEFGAKASWPNLRPFRLRLAAGAASPDWNDAARMLTVFVSPGVVSAVRLSCHLRDSNDLSLLGMAKWLEDGIDRSDGALGAFREQTRLGLTWMVIPHRELTLVHAVQQPVAAPEIVAFPQPIKMVDQTFVNIRAKVHVHGASTGSLELMAQWTEIADDRNSLSRRPEARIRQSLAFATPFYLTTEPTTSPRGLIPEAVFDAATDMVEYLAPRIEQFDAQFHQQGAEVVRLKKSAMVKINALRPPHTALAGVVDNVDVASVNSIIQLSPLLKRWRDIVPRAEKLRDDIQQIFDDADGGHTPGEDAAGNTGVIPQPIRRDLQDMQATATRMIATVQETFAAMFNGRHEFGDTRHRRVTYRAVGTSRFAEAFSAESGTLLDFTRSSEAIVVDVLSSAAPPPPVVRHVIPAFEWTRSSPDAQTRESSRRGGVLRVYLERPWFSSGENEMLAVVLGPDPSTAGFDRIEPFVSRWGRDPLLRSAPTPNTLSPENFRNATVVREAVTPQDADAPSQVTLVAYPVSYADDGQCFCDIEIIAGSAYFPFVRLVLARFQPQSIPTLEMSRVTRADFAQPVPDRGVSVVTRAVGVFDVVVTGATHTSPTNPQFFTGTTGTHVRVTVQSRIPGTRDDAGWLPAPEPVIIPEPSAVDEVIRWKGQIRLPVGAAAGEFRVLVEELELHLHLDIDIGVVGPQASAFPRVVFAETVEL
jgi:hypothetical protein